MKYEYMLNKHFPVVFAADDGDQLSKGYDYLLGMKIWSLTLERVRLLENELEAKTEEMAQLKVRGFGDTSAFGYQEIWLPRFFNYITFFCC